MREDRFRQDRRTLFNAWLTLNNPLPHRDDRRGGLGLHHHQPAAGLGGNETLLSCLTAARGAELPAIVRVAENDPGLIGRALDAGAQGIMCPMIETVEDAEAFVKSVKYPHWLAQLGPLPGAARLRLHSSRSAGTRW
jgi:4-hydroxy-2-oxoheptanedioate aldolase